MGELLNKAVQVSNTARKRPFGHCRCGNLQKVLEIPTFELGPLICWNRSREWCSHHNCRRRLLPRGLEDPGLTNHIAVALATGTRTSSTIWLGFVTLDVPFFASDTTSRYLRMICPLAGGFVDLTFLVLRDCGSACGT